MITKKINGYTVQVAHSRTNQRFRFVTLIDEQGQRHHFNMDNSGGGGSLETLTRCRHL
jgi:translation elongation factor EF-1alpha